MLQLIGHELYKLFRNKGIGIAFLLCLIVYGLYAYSEKPPVFNDYHKVYSYYKSGEGTVSSADLKAAAESRKRLKIKYDQGVRYNDKELAESFLYRDIENVEKQSAEYKALMQKLASESDAVSRLQLSRMEKVGPLESAYYLEGWRATFEGWSKIVRYLAILLGVFGLSRIFPDEKASGMNVLIGSTKEGRRRLVLAKLAAAFIFVSLETVIFAFINLMTNTFFFGFAGWNVPLKNLFFQTGYAFQLWQFWIFKLMMGILVVAIFGMISVLASRLTRTGIGGIVAAGLVYTAHFKTTEAAAAVDQAYGLGSLIWIDFTKLKQICVSYLHTYTLAGVTVTYEQVFAGSCILLLAMLVLATYFSGGRYGTD